MTKQLTAAAVARLRPTDERREVRDGGAPGLSLTIQPSGAKSWTMRFRRPDGRPAKLTLGPVDMSGREATGEPVMGAPLTLAGARWLAGEVHRRRASGRDVVADRRAEKQLPDRADDFAAAARDFVDEHARPKTRRWRERARLLGLDYPAGGGEPAAIRGGLAERWQGRPVGDIDGHDVHGVVDEARRRGVPGVAAPRNTGASDARGQAMARALSKLFSWLMQHRRVAANPCVGMYVPPSPPARDRVLTDAEVRLFWSATESIGEPFGPLLKVLLLTGARRDEVARMTRGELSDDLTIWNLPGGRTKNKRPHAVPLPSPARDLIAGVKRVAGKPGFVFTTSGASPVSGFSKTKARLDAAMLRIARESDRDASISPWRIHDLRRTAATGMAEIGVAPHVVEAALNHVSGARAGVAGTYNRAIYAEEKKAALERWAAHIEAVVAGRPGRNVVGMRRARS